MFFKESTIVLKIGFQILAYLKGSLCTIFFELRTIVVIALRRRLNFSQLACVFVCFAFFLHALLRIRICFFMKVVIHGGSVGRIVTCLLGIQESVISVKRL